MINKIYIETESRNVYPERDMLGISGENKFETLQFNLDSFIDGQALLRVERKETSGTAKYEIAVQKEDNCYTLEVLSSLLMYKGLIKMQLVIMNENLEVFKSKTFNMKVLEEIEGAQEIPEQYPTWQQLANQKIIEMNNKITEVTALEEDLEDKVQNGYFKGDKGDTGEPGQNGTDGLNGTDGKSAYQIWLDEGNEGTEQDFLDSLKGVDGIDGQNGKDGINGTNGQDGYTPVKGTDYWTNADKAEIVQDTIQGLQATLSSNLQTAKDYTDNQIARDFKNISYDNTTATFVFTRHDNTTFTVDLPIEQTVKNGYYDNLTEELVLVLVSNQEIRIPASGLIDDYSGQTSATIQCSISADNKITCNIVSGSISKTLLTSELQTEINNKATKEYVDNLFNSIIDGDEVSY